MRAVVLINAKAGTVVERGGDDLCAEVREAFAAAGHAVEAECCDPADMADRIGRTALRTDIDAIVAGGGDGTLSMAAAKLAGRKVALGFLPLGTMNLYCRALGMPQDLDGAIRSLAHGRVEPADLGEVNGRLFLHHVSIGLQPSIVARRNGEDYSGRLGKMWATAKTFVRTLRNPKPVSVVLRLPGGDRPYRVPAIFVMSNPLRDGRPGIEQHHSAHRLGVYICTSVEWSDLLQIAAGMAAAARQDVDCLELHTAPEVAIDRAHKSRKGFRASVDGEIVAFNAPLKIACRKDAFRLLVPEGAPRG
jgi:diacylglycerol kinase family enzyme